MMPEGIKQNKSKTILQHVRRQLCHRVRRCVSVAKRHLRAGSSHHVVADPRPALRGVAVLEGEHPVEGAGHAGRDREHHPSLRQVQGRLVDVGRALQPRADPARRDGRQDGQQEEPRSADAALPQVGARAPELVPQGWAVRQRRGGRRHLLGDRPLARVAQVCAHPVPASVVQCVRRRCERD